ncbi:HNH endonuclease [Terribacillus saccharophilus]|uniref:HNH endonuclease n=1 Tax=Terribacillus saccharophilus TaxID=361277 RepID=UPI003D2CE426
MTKEIPLGGKRANGKCAIVDDEDYEKLSKFNWWCNSDGYAIRIEYEGRKYKRQIFMHREIMDPGRGKMVDHKNRNITDNRRSNLRAATPSQNQINRSAQTSNTSGYKGVTFDCSANKWRASITHNKKLQHLGFYDTKEDAALIYNQEAIKIYGEYAFLNDVPFRKVTSTRINKSSRFLGVTYDKRTKRYKSTIAHNKKTFNLGYFENELDAARFYNFWAFDLRGETAKVNEVSGKIPVLVNRKGTINCRIN